jgi:hypothetical protein
LPLPAISNQKKHGATDTARLLARALFFSFAKSPLLAFGGFFMRLTCALPPC